MSNVCAYEYVCYINIQAYILQAYHKHVHYTCVYHKSVCYLHVFGSHMCISIISHMYICKYICHTHVYSISLTTSAEETGMGRILAILYLPECCYVLWKPLETMS